MTVSCWLLNCYSNFLILFWLILKITITLKTVDIDYRGKKSINIVLALISRIISHIKPNSYFLYFLVLNSFSYLPIILKDLLAT